MLYKVYPTTPTQSYPTLKPYLQTPPNSYEWRKKMKPGTPQTLKPEAKKEDGLYPTILQYDEKNNIHFLFFCNTDEDNYSCMHLE